MTTHYKMYYILFIYSVLNLFLFNFMIPYKIFLVNYKNDYNIIGSIDLFLLNLIIVIIGILIHLILNCFDKNCEFNNNNINNNNNNNNNNNGYKNNENQNLKVKLDINLNLSKKKEKV